MIFINGYDNDLYNTLLSEKKGWSKKTIETSTKDSKGNSHARTEVVWMNKYFNKALTRNRITIKLTDKEQKQGKINPERE